MPECPAREDLRTYGLAQAREKGVPETMYERQIQQESGWQHCRPDGSLKVSSGNAIGVAQIIQRWHPNVDVTDPWASLRYSTDLMDSHRQRYGSWRKALAAYNWGGGHVGGGRFDDGRGFGVQDHSPWDGTRDWQCSAGHGVSEQCKHYLDVILGPGWPEPDDVAPAPPAPSDIVYEDYRDPEPAGRFASMPKGVILHGSRSGRAGNPKDAEYRGTANWEVNNPAGLGWNATIGENKVAVHLTPQEWGWNARGSSDNWLAVEIAQATVDEPVTDPQVAALADWIKTRVLPVWPNLPMMFPSHAELDGTPEYGPRDGKSDVFPKSDERMENLRTRLMTLLMKEPEVPVPSTYSVGPGILAKMAEYGDEPATDEIYIKSSGKDAYSEAYGQTGARYVYIASLNRTFRYAPAA